MLSNYVGKFILFISNILMFLILWTRLLHDKKKTNTVLDGVERPNLFWLVGEKTHTVVGHGLGIGVGRLFFKVGCWQ